LVDELDIEDFFVFAHFLGSEAYCKWFNLLLFDSDFLGGHVHERDLREADVQALFLTVVS
jgi:hypothetical protein